MKVLMICGVYARENEKEVIDQARGAVEFSANLFQQKLIAGFRKTGCDFHALSAPFLGAYPTASDSVYFHGFRKPADQVQYVTFNNIWAIRNLSRARSLKKALRSFAEDPCPDKMIVVYCPHTPFLEAAAYAKKLDERIRICFYVPDLPNYMNLSARRSLLYDAAKVVDNAWMRRYMETVDSYVLLTEPMKTALPVGEKPYIVAEGIMEKLPGQVSELRESDDPCKYIVYTGKLNEKFGVRDLVDAFSLLTEPDYRLVLCGDGDCMAYVKAAVQMDDRIIATGQITPDQAAMWQRKAAVLINPRPNNEEYTKYSFPSKIVEYLATGTPVVSYILDGMPACYRDFLWEIDDHRPCVEAIVDAVKRAVSSSEEERAEKRGFFTRYAAENLCAERIARRMIDMTLPHLQS